MNGKKTITASAIRGPVADMIWDALQSGKMIVYTRRKVKGETLLDVNIE